MNRLKVKVYGYSRIREEVTGSCIGCFNFNKHVKDNIFCETVNCIGYIWIKEEDMSDQKELEIFMLEYLTENIEEIEREYYRSRIDSILPDIKKVIKGHPLRDEIVEAVKDCIVSNGNTPDNIFIKAIQKIEGKLGYRQ